MTVSGGAVVYASDINTIEGKTSDKPICRLSQQAAQTGNASGATLTLSFGSGSEVVDTDGFHDETTNNTRITPNKPGWYRVIVQPILAFNANLTSVNSAVIKNGSVVQRSGNHRPNTSAVNCAGMTLESWHTANGTTDYFEGGVTAVTSSGTWDTNAVAASTSTFSVEFMRDL